MGRILEAIKELTKGADLEDRERIQKRQLLEGRSINSSKRSQGP